jgi:hypothetical protein
MALATNREINQNQVAALLATITQVGGTLVSLEEVSESPERSGDDPRVPLDATLLNACARLDSILSDDSRWTLPEMDGHLSQQGVAHQQEQALALDNKLKAYEILEAELNKRRAMFAAAQSLPVEKPVKTNVKRKKQ